MIATAPSDLVGETTNKPRVGTSSSGSLANLAVTFRGYPLGRRRDAFQVVQ
jgi:hypothetical protein